MPQSSGAASHFGATMPPRGQVDSYGYLDCDKADGHVLVPDRGSTNSTNKPCVYCKLRGIKTTTGLPIKTYWKCDACNLPLCRPRQRDCFKRYHQLLQNMGSDTGPDITGLLA